MNPQHKRQLTLALWRIKRHLIRQRITPVRYWRLMAYLISEHKP